MKIPKPITKERCTSCNPESCVSLGSKASLCDECKTTWRFIKEKLIREHNNKSEQRMLRERKEELENELANIDGILKA